MVVQYEGVPSPRYFLEEYITWMMSQTPSFLYYSSLNVRWTTTYDFEVRDSGQDWAMLRNTLWPQHTLSHKQFQRQHQSGRENKTHCQHQHFRPCLLQVLTWLLSWSIWSLFSFCSSISWLLGSQNSESSYRNWMNERSSWEFGHDQRDVFDNLEYLNYSCFIDPLTLERTMSIYLLSTLMWPSRNS